VSEENFFNDWPVEDQLAYALEMGWPVKAENVEDGIKFTIEVPVKLKKMSHARLMGLTLEAAVESQDKEG
jgi:hypothetical protein